MTEKFRYHFEWDPRKESANRRKHGITFGQAAKVFSDPLALTLHDQNHSDEEDRWITLGQSGNGSLLVVVHTYQGIERIGSDHPDYFGQAGHQTRKTRLRDRHMREEYDFSKGERGKFYKPNAKQHLPVYLDEEILNYLQGRAQAKDVDVNQLINDMLRREIEIIEAVK